MAPHEAQCQRNHSQSIVRIAQRGGFGCSEAYCVVNGIRWYDMEKTIGHAEAKRLWIQFAERINLHYAELERYKAALDKIASFGEGPVVTASFDEPGSAKIARDALNPPAH